MPGRLLVLVILLCGFQLRALAALPIGNLDGVNHATVWGWTCDPDNWNKQVWVHLYATGTSGNGTCHMIGADRVCYIGGGRANVPREAAVGTACGNGSPAHGFVVATPGYIADGQPHTVYAYGLDSPTSKLLVGSITYTSLALIHSTTLWTQPSLGPGELGQRWRNAYGLRRVWI
jgi:hypothetical protein